jgi:hypothetical protein
MRAVIHPVQIMKPSKLGFFGVGARSTVGSEQAVPQTVFLDPGLVIVKKSLFAAQKSFFDHSKAIGRHCKSKTRPAG